MARPLRHMNRPYQIFEVSIRCVQERFLLRPSKKLNDLVLGVIGRALDIYPHIRIYIFKIASNHYHLILAAPDHQTFSAFMNHIDSNIAREAGRLHDWRDKFWSRRYRPISIEDDASLLKQVKYILAHGCKEGLVASPMDWPGASCERALLFGEKLEGTWYDRASYYEAERRGKQKSLEDFATKYTVPLTTLPILEGMSEEEQHAFFRELVDEIERETNQACMDEKKQLLGVEAVLSQHPHARPFNSKRSPAPICYASNRNSREKYRRMYKKFVSIYRQAVDRLRRGDKDVRFPEGCFLPPLLCPPQLVQAAAPG